MIDLLVILTVCCGIYTIAGVASRAIETYERMKEHRREANGAVETATGAHRAWRASRVDLSQR